VTVLPREDGHGYVARVQSQGTEPVDVALPNIANVQRVVVLPPGDQAAIVGEMVAGYWIGRVDATGTITATFNAARVSIDERTGLAALVRYLPRWAPEDAGDQYAVVDLAHGSVDDNAPGTVFYPADTTAQHFCRSRLFWVDPDVAAFIDYASGAAALVAVRFNADATIARLEAKNLDAALFVQVPGEADAAVHIAYPVAITRVENQEGLVLRIEFNDSYHLKVGRADVVVWQ
jgi:hypothetical protein